MGRFRFRPSYEAVCEVTVGDRRLVAYSGHRKVIRLADLSAREDIAVITGSRAWIRALCAVPVDGGTRLASGGRRGVLCLWNPGAPSEPPVRLKGHRGWVNALCTVRVAGRELLASAGADRVVRLWDPRDGSLVRAIDTGSGRGWIFALSAVRTGGRTLIAAGHGLGSVTVWHPESGQRYTELTGHRGFVWTLCEVSDGDRTLLASGGRDGIVRLWDLEERQEARALTGGSGPVYALCQADVGERRLLVVGGDGPGTAVRDPSTGDHVGALGMDLAGLLGGHGWARAVCQVRPFDGPPLVVTAGYDDAPRVWDVAKELS
ncbi:WD40 repeat domain-containing protein [Streptomyces cynarae]|uniref:WD40 repeat domain-containing protein n=1 Tax=Streptomyces cynarae TaxID=2981134 RepID=UPI00406D373A